MNYTTLVKGLTNEQCQLIREGLIKFARSIDVKSLPPDTETENVAEFKSAQTLASRSRFLETLDHLIDPKMVTEVVTTSGMGRLERFKHVGVDHILADALLNEALKKTEARNSTAITETILTEILIADYSFLEEEVNANAIYEEDAFDDEPDFIEEQESGLRNCWKFFQISKDRIKEAFKDHWTDIMKTFDASWENYTALEERGHWKFLPKPSECSQDFIESEVRQLHESRQRELIREGKMIAFPKRKK